MRSGGNEKADEKHEGETVVGMESRKDENIEGGRTNKRERERMKSAGAREYVTGMARGQLTFIILTLMDYLIPYIPSRTPLRRATPPLRLQTPFSAFAKVRDNIHGCIQANAPRHPVEKQEEEEKQRVQCRTEKGERVRISLKVTRYRLAIHACLKLPPKSVQTSPIRKYSLPIRTRRIRFDR